MKTPSGLEELAKAAYVARYTAKGNNPAADWERLLAPRDREGWIRAVAVVLLKAGEELWPRVRAEHRRNLDEHMRKVAEHRTAWRRAEKRLRSVAKGGAYK